MLLGVTGDQVLPKEVYEKIKADYFITSAWYGSSRYFKRRSSTKHLYFFSTEFSLRVMGDVQQYFIDQKVRNFYSVSISGYHIAEAGANPISQLAFTLANGFTFVEYYLSVECILMILRQIYHSSLVTVSILSIQCIGRVSRRIWAKP
jgi:methylmalonyl-CoA mutase